MISRRFYAVLDLQQFLLGGQWNRQDFGITHAEPGGVEETVRRGGGRR